jgi:hypothetical protein
VESGKKKSEEIRTALNKSEQAPIFLQNLHRAVRAAGGEGWCVSAERPFGRLEVPLGRFPGNDTEFRPAEATEHAVARSSQVCPPGTLLRQALRRLPLPHNGDRNGATNRLWAQATQTGGAAVLGEIKKAAPEGTARESVDSA